MRANFHGVLVIACIFLVALSNTACTFNASIRNLDQASATDNSKPESNSPSLIAPSAFSYPVTTLAANLGQSISPLNPTVSGSSLEFRVSPSLPAGLSLNSSTGIISGTPLVAQLAMTYTLTASNSGGSIQSQLIISVSGYYSVSVLTDTVDATVGDGLCANSVSACSLRAAIQESNALFSASGVPSTIDVTASGTLTLTLSTLSITGKMQLNGHGLTINGNSASRVMSITGSDVNLSNIVITNGAVAGDGAGILHSNSSGKLVLDNVTITNNVAGTAGFLGGGIYSNGSFVSISNSTISNNTNGQNNAGYGGGIAFSGNQLEVVATVVSGNYGGRRGGGLYFTSGSGTDSVLIRESHVQNNDGGTHSGGLENYGSHNVTIESSSFYDNVGQSGDISNHGPMMFIKSSTLVGTDVGGVVLQATSSDGFTLTDSTVSTNGTPIFLTFTNLALSRSILVSTTGGTVCAITSSTITSGGNNLTNGSSCGLAATGDLQNQTPSSVLNSFVPVQSGITYYLPLKNASPAIDAGGTSCPATDQLGLTRPVDKGGGLKCDIGASETQ